MVLEIEDAMKRFTCWLIECVHFKAQQTLTDVGSKK